MAAAAAAAAVANANKVVVERLAEAEIRAAVLQSSQMLKIRVAADTPAEHCYAKQAQAACRHSPAGY